MSAPLQKIAYDKAVDSLYIYANKKSKVVKTIKFTPRVLFDVDKKGVLIGIEVLNASMPFSLKEPTKQAIAVVA